MNFEPMNFYEFLETSKNERLLNEFYSISNINFDFDKVSAFLKDQVPDFCKFCFDFMDIFNEGATLCFSKDSLELVKQYPELHDYIECQVNNHDYKLDEDNKFSYPSCIIVDFDTFSRNKDMFSYLWLREKVLDDFFLIEYSKFFSECSL